jgi:anti-sigma factor RsiW
MTVSPETLLAFIDGELSPEEARRVAAEVANDPALAAHTEKHRALKARLQAVSLPSQPESPTSRASRSGAQARSMPSVTATVEFGLTT